jgi:hypothetical protein
MEENNKDVYETATDEMEEALEETTSMTDAGQELAPAESAPGFFEIIYGMFFSPAATFSALARFPVASRAAIFFLLVQLLSSINGMAVVREQFPDLVGTGIVFFPVLLIIMAFIGWFLNTSVLQLLAEFQGGKGRGIQLFTALGFAYAPSLFSAPVTLLLSNTYPRLLNVITFIITIWVIVLNVLAIRVIHGFSTGKAVWTLLIPLFSILLLFVGFVILTILVIMGMGLTEFPGFPGL